ncbi:hypothetical protein K432DRAFT_381364 [Lepidopterella palustris CBS 459.81]|uniref:Uncharacterized protein n=1 Tax=Lepidopterella palustris CBS 459.81 TaxID=1314670 RepID=A0A8E2JG57_9PEZI|nr:hypothetical protein K432DRAFT_381364 [Lepidopterella palustris CBS 459.81]
MASHTQPCATKYLATTMLMGPCTAIHAYAAAPLAPETASETSMRCRHSLCAQEGRHGAYPTAALVWEEGAGEVVAAL